MHKNNSVFLIFIGGKYYNDLPQIESELPNHLSKFGKTICFEYPRFKTIFKILFGKTPLIRKLSDNLFIYHSFGILPFGRTLILVNLVNHFINYLIMRIYFQVNLDKTEIITLTPELALLSLLIKKAKVFYYVIDNYIFLPWWSNKLQQKQFVLLDKKISRLASKIFTVSPSLLQRYKSMNKNTYLFPIPGNLSYYINIKKNIIPDRIKKIGHPIVGFIGSIYEWKIDIQLLLKLLNKFKNISFVFIGTIKVSGLKLDELKANNNFYYLSKIVPKDLPYYVKHFDAGIIPYKVDNYGKYAYPVKIMEYLVFGIPIVATALPSINNLRDKGLIYWAESDRAFIKYLEIASKERSDLKMKEMRTEEAMRNSWPIKIKEFLSIIRN